MTVILQLSPEMVELAQELADERDTNINALLSQVVAEYLEEQEDLADARERVRLLQEGKTQTRSWADVRAELLARAEDSSV